VAFGLTLEVVLEIIELVDAVVFELALEVIVDMIELVGAITLCPHHSILEHSATSAAHPPFLQEPGCPSLTPLLLLFFPFPGMLVWLTKISAPLHSALKFLVKLARSRSFCLHLAPHFY
jgi:hypothetical protein